MNRHIENWNNTNLGSLLKNKKQKGHHEEELLSVTRENGIIRRDSLERRDTSNKDKGKYLLVDKGDIAYNTMRMWQGVSGVSSYRGIVSPAYTVCSTTEKIDSKFASYLLKDPAMILLFKQRSQGLVSDTWNLKYENFSQIPCSLPPLVEQKKIAEILSGIDNLITKKRDLNKKNNLLLKAFIDELLEGDENWERVFLSKILLFKNGLNTSKENFGVGTPFVSYKNVYAGGLIKEEDLTECVSLTPSEEDRFCLKRGDILFTRTSETPDEIGFNAVYNTSVPAVFNGFCIRGRPLNDSLLVPEFSSFCFRTNAVLSQMRSLCKYTTRAGISAESLGKVQIMIPPINVQEKIANSLSSLKQLIRVVDRSIYSLENLKHSISQDLLSGRQRVKV